MILVVARLPILAGAMTAMLAEVTALARHSRSEQGCHEYTYLQSPEEDALLVFIQRWKDRRASRQTRRRQRWRRAAGLRRRL